MKNSIILICGLSLCFACFGLTRTRAGEIFGKATEKGGTAAVQGVVVEVLSKNGETFKTNTGKDGTYKVPISTEGDYRINFSNRPDTCIYPYKDKTFKTADESQEENVTVVRARNNGQIASTDLLEAIKARWSKRDDPEALNAVAALSTTGIGTDILKEVGTALAEDNPKFLAPVTATISNVQSDAIQVRTKLNRGPTEFKISNETAFTDAAGKSVPSEWLGKTLIGQKATVFTGLEGDQRVLKSVVFTSSLEDLSKATSP